MSTFNWQNPYPMARMPVFARNVVATSHPLAAQAGLRAMWQGGNAVDAAIAAAAALTVVEPVSNGLGSDAFALVWDGGKLHGLNASGACARGVERRLLQKEVRRGARHRTPAEARLGHGDGAWRCGRLGGAAYPVRLAAFRRFDGEPRSRSRSAAMPLRRSSRINGRRRCPNLKDLPGFAAGVHAARPCAHGRASSSAFPATRARSQDRWRAKARVPTTRARSPSGSPLSCKQCGGAMTLEDLRRFNGRLGRADREGLSRLHRA